MHPYPHLYTVAGSCIVDGPVTLAMAGVPTLNSAPPAEFDGPGDLWSPETLLCAAVADCFVLSFRAVATASKFTWQSLECSVQGTLDRVERVSQFTRFDIQAKLTAAPGTDAVRAKALLEKAEHVCLISNSLKGEIHLVTEIAAG
ncbi:MAG TPA: OsmC family protein [Steroidobacteraceae bacterium]